MRYQWAAAVIVALAGCAQTPPAAVPAPAPVPDYPTTVPGLVTVAPLRHDSDVALIAPDIEQVIWARTTLEAAQVKAAPPPPPPPRCPDGDGDGVCDADDQCPNTPAGDRVGPFGCSCDVTIRTHFAFDSAVLTAEDKATLDGVATRLKELQFVEGTATGHTDSIGTEEYNQRLSERRAQAVVDYLAGLGVYKGRIKAIGMGESSPTASNETEEGRAQNRRVVLRRVDCAGRP
jgi:outer membrane protein OmpA-like peptidoglycan-associated protein